MATEDGFWKKWGKFCAVIFSPGSVIPFLGSGGVLLRAATLPAGGEANFLFVVASILAAVGGFFINDDWQKYRGNSILEKKGKSAIRNLGSIGQQIADLREWIRGFVASNNVTSRDLEEIDRHLDTTELNIKSGLEDWTDIVPELKEGEQVAKQFAEVAKGYVVELLKNRQELLNLLQIGDEAPEEKQKLEKRIKEIEKNVQELNRDEKRVVPAIAYARPLGLHMHTCTTCKKRYPVERNEPALNHRLCPDCRTEPEKKKTKKQVDK